MPFLESILALFVIVDPIGNIPAFLGVSAGLDRKQRQKAFTISVVVAAVILVLFSFAGNLVLRSIFQIEIADLRIAGGILLVVMAIDDLVFSSKRKPKTADQALSAEEIGCVPMGCPLLAGPGAIVTTLAIWNNPQAGPAAALLAIFLVLTLFRVVMYYVDEINRMFGRLVITAVSKVMLVFLAAIGVKMIIAGVKFYFPMGQ